MFKNKLVKISDLFDVQYGNSFELNRLIECKNGINFVSRTSKNNGVSSKVKSVNDIAPFDAGIITVALSGSVLETFLQPQPFYTGYHIFCLTAKQDLTDQEKLFYCSCIRANKFRYNYGRQANRTLKDLLVPSLQDIPDWIKNKNIAYGDNISLPVKSQNLRLSDKEWDWFLYEDLFSIERGRGPRKNELDGNGSVPFVTSTDQNNGWTSYTTASAIHCGNVISVNRNGSVAEAYFQPIPFCSTEDVHIFTPKFKINKYIAMFLITLIKKEKYRYNYGRKWGIARMNSSKIKLPINSENKPDWVFIEDYIKSIEFSNQI